jgi:hypothetical protein
LWLGCVAGTRIGVWLLASIPAAPMKMALSVAGLVAVALMWSGYARKSMPSTLETMATGGIAGLLNGAFGILAPPVIVFFFSSPAGVAISRASLIAFFIGTDTMGLAFLARKGAAHCLGAFSTFCCLFQHCCWDNGAAREAFRRPIRPRFAYGSYASWRCWLCSPGCKGCLQSSRSQSVV